MKNNAMHQLSIGIDPKQIRVFYPLLQQGFRLNVVVGQSIHSLLKEVLHIDAEYIEERIKTVFLDGKPVDDFHSAIVTDGATVSLSAAMPGLVGATFRKGGPLASLRGSITHQKRDEKIETREGHVTLKLFNLLVKELGSGLLEQGVEVHQTVWEDLVQQRSEAFWNNCPWIRINGRDVAPAELSNLNAMTPSAFVTLKVATQSE